MVTEGSPVEDAPRLAALKAYGILDTPPERGFDDITTLATILCGTPVALVSLIDRDRQWFKARVGFEPCETDLDSSVCRYALGRTDILEIEDLAHDPRTQENPLVTGTPFIRFYAGAPLNTLDGRTLGSLCVIDTEPRPGGLTQVQRVGLTALANQVMAQLELKRAVAERDGAYGERAADQRRYQQVIDSTTEFAIVVTDRDGVVTEWNTGAERILGWSAEERIGSSGEVIFTQEDRASGRVHVEMAEALNGGRGVDERWHMRKGGTRFWASGELMPLRDDDGAHIGFVKILRDRTEQHQVGQALVESRVALEASESKWRGLFQNLEEGFVLGRVVRDGAGDVVDWRFEEVNRAWGDLVGLDATAILGKTLREAFPGIEDVWVGEFAAVVSTGEAIRFTHQVGVLGRWYDGVCQPAGDDRFTVIFLEVTDRIAAERRRDALHALGDRLRDADGASAIAATAGEIVGSALNATRVGFGLVDAHRGTVDVHQNWTADGAASVAGLHDFRSFGSYVDDLLRGETVIVRDVRTDPRTAGAGADALEAIHVRTLVNVPILERNRLVGIAFVHFAEPREWSDEDTALLRNAADRTLLAVARVRAEDGRALLNRELSHRLKNTLAMVQAIATQTLRTAPDMAAARSTLIERISVLSRAHDILIDGQRDAASIDDIVRSSTALYDASGRVRATGPDVPLGPKASMTLSLILHELATNAAKYGALSNANGHVDVEWSIEPDADTGRRLLTFEWREVGGPPVTEPTCKSFGTRLIAMGLSGSADGSSELTYAPDGVRCRLVALLTELMADDVATP